MQRVVRQLVDAVGIGDAIEICRRWGGRDFRVPKKVEKHDPLALTLGFESARKLVEAFGGTVLQLPIERNALLDLRNQAIYDAIQRGESHEKVALEYGLRRQAINKILRMLRDRGIPVAATEAAAEQ